MILIGGTDLKAEDLPMSDIIEYQVESGKKLDIKLKTIGKTPDCFAIYLNESQRSEVTITDAIINKLTFYKDDKELISLLMGDTEEQSGFEEEDLDIELPDFGVPKSKQKKEEDELSEFEADSTDIFEDTEDIFEDSSDMFEGSFEDTSDIFEDTSDIFEDTSDIFEDTSDIFEDTRVALEENDSTTEDIFGNNYETNEEPTNEIEGTEEEVTEEEVTEEEVTEEEVTEEEVTEEEVTEEEVTEEEVTEEEVTVSEEEILEVEEPIKEVPYYENLEDVDTELPDVFLQIPNLGDDTDSLRLQLETKDRIIKQKEGMIKEFEQEREDIYKLQEIQIKEIQELYNNKMEEVNKVVSDLEKKSKHPQLEDEALDFLKFHNYSKNYRAALREGFTEMERMNMGRLNSKYYIFSSGSGDSLYSMLRNVKHFIESNNNAVVVDFSNDPFLATAFAKNIKSINGLKPYSMDLNNDNSNLLEMFTSFSKTKVLFSPRYNDIALLNFNWVEIIKKVDEYAGGKPVIFLFNNINSFSVKYTVSKLATIGSLYVFVKCSPLILTTLYSEVNFIPEDRVNIVAMEYIDMVKNVLNIVASKYLVLPFTRDIEWKKILK